MMTKHENHLSYKYRATALKMANSHISALEGEERLVVAISLEGQFKSKKFTPVSLGDALPANRTGRPDGDLLRLGHDLGPSDLDKVVVAQELVEHGVNERDVFGQVLRSLAPVAAAAASQVVGKRGDMIEKLVHEVPRDVLS